MSVRSPYSLKSRGGSHRVWQQKRTQLPVPYKDFATENKAQTPGKKHSVKGIFVLTLTWTPQARNRVCQSLSKSTLTDEKLQEMWEICKCRLRISQFSTSSKYGNKFVPMIGYINTQKNFRVIGTLEGPARKPNPLGSNKITMLLLISPIICKWFSYFIAIPFFETFRVLGYSDPPFLFHQSVE